MIKGNRRENGQRGREEGRVRKSRKEIKRERSEGVGRGRERERKMDEFIEIQNGSTKYRSNSGLLTQP